MASKGFVSYSRANRRKLLWLVLQHVLVIEALAALIMTFVLAFVDPGNIPFANPVGYALRYASPVAAVSLGIFSFIYIGHTREIIRKLGIVVLAQGGDPLHRRFLTIAEPAATVAGLRRPSFGVIQTGALDALSVGSSRASGLIAVTTGLVEALDDDELAAVVAHQAIHIRNGDTEIAAANFALARTAINLQVNNPLRVEDWRQALLVLAVPFILPALLAGGMMTMLAMIIARGARRGIALSRDTVADAEAVRITLFPEALISAIRRTTAGGGVDGAMDLHGLMFSAGGTTRRDCEAHAQARIDLIQDVAGDLMASGRHRADTRPQRRLFGAQPTQSAKPVATTENDDVFSLHPPPLRLLITDTAEYRRLYRRFTDHWEWTEEKSRDLFGLKPAAVAPLVIAVAFLVGLHWPSDGNYARAARIFDPTQLISLTGVQNGTFSSTSQHGQHDAEGRQGGGGLNLFPGLSAESRKKQGWLMAIIVLGLGVAAQVPGLREHISPRYRPRKSREPKPSRSNPPPRALSRVPVALPGRNTSFEERVGQRLRELNLEPSAGAAASEAVGEDVTARASAAPAKPQDRGALRAGPLVPPPFGRGTFGTRRR